MPGRHADPQAHACVGRTGLRQQFECTLFISRCRWYILRTEKKSSLVTCGFPFAFDRGHLFAAVVLGLPAPFGKSSCKGPLPPESRAVLAGLGEPDTVAWEGWRVTAPLPSPACI